LMQSMPVSDVTANRARALILLSNSQIF